MTQLRDYIWILQGVLAILIIFMVSLLYDPVASLSIMLHDPIELPTTIDLLIPLFPPAIIIYWYLFYTFIFFTYVYFGFLQREGRNALVLGFVLVNLIAYAIYLVFPVRGPERIVLGTDFFSQQIQLLYNTDVQVNCFPSLHGSTSLLSAYSLWKVKKEYGRISWPIAVLVMISTLFVRQHWIVDQILATVITIPIAYFVFDKLPQTRIEPPLQQISRHQLLIALVIAFIAMVLYIASFALF